MPFEKGEIPKGATPFQPGNNANPNGRPIGSKNRSTIARKILEMKALYKDDALSKLQEQYPEITKDTTVEEMMTIIQINRAIMSEDPNSYKAVLDSAYGAPKQDMDIRGNVAITDQPIIFE